MAGDTTVYVNDNPIGETEVYHSRKAHVSTLDRWRDRYTRETTVSQAREDGLRPCKTCFPDESTGCCPACGYPGVGDVIDKSDLMACENEDCAVESYRDTSD